MPGSYGVQVKAKLASGSVAGGRAGLLFDFKDNFSTYRFVILPGATSGDNWLVQKLVSGSWTMLSATSHGWANNMLSRDEYNLLRVERQGTTVRAYLNGVQLWSGSDATYANGQAGLNIGTPVDLAAGAYFEAIFDDFLIENLR